MSNVIPSVEHTGTHFIREFLDSIGVTYFVYHTLPEEVSNIKRHYDARYIVPMLDPLTCFTSHLSQRTHLGFKPSVTHILDYLIPQFEVLDLLIEDKEHIFLKLTTKDRPKELQAVADFCGSKFPISNFVWSEIPSREADPTGYNTWEVMKKGLTIDEIDFVLEKLAPARRIHGYI